jgi:NADPH:quinone reductase-like Zn-dependent oxidoreductase
MPVDNNVGVTASEGSSATEEAAKPGPMRAILQSGYGSLDVLSVGVRERPSPGAGEVLVKVHAAGVDRGTWHLMTGRPYLMRLMGFGFSGPINPVPGLDVSGIVVALGAGVTRFELGDAVFGIAQGSFAEYACAREDKLARKPSSLGFEQAAVAGVSAITALQGLRDVGKLEAGERVLIIGASGGVGSYAVQIAKAFGARVTGVCSTSKLEFVRSLGADDVLDYMRQDFVDGSRRYDLIFDIAGHTSLARLRRAMTETGRLVFVGDEQGGDWTAGFERTLGAMLLGLFVRQRFLLCAGEEHYRYLERMRELYEAGTVAPAIGRRYRLQEVPDAIVDLVAGRISGKAVVTVAEAR